MTMKFRKFSLFAINLTFFVIVQALYEDQIGKFDWRHQFLGKVVVGKIDSSDDSLNRRFFVATEQNVLASINSDNGETIWRQIEEKNGKVDDILVHRNDVILVTDRNRRKTVRSFDVLHGSLRWEYSLHEENCKKSKLIGLDSKHVALLACDRIFTLDNFGDLEWSAPLKLDQAKFYDSVLLPGLSEFAVAVKRPSTTDFYVFDIASGNLVAEKSFPSQSSTDGCTFLHTKYVCVDLNGGIVNYVSLQDFAESSSTLPSKLSAKVAKFIELDSSACFGIIDENSVGRVYCLEKDGRLAQKSKIYEHVSAINIASHGEKRFAVFLVCRQSSFCELKWLDLTSGEEQSQASIKIDKRDEINGVEQVFPFISIKSGVGITYRAIVTGVDHAIAAFQSSSKMLWARQEALALILSVEMLDLPLSESQASVESEFSSNGQNIVSMFARRLTTQAKQIQRGFFRLLNESLILLGAFTSSSDWLTVAKSVTARESHEMTALERDYFNLHKVIVVVTAVGKVFGLDNRRGKILWQFYDSNVNPFTVFDKPVYPLFVQRTTAHFPHPARCALIGRHKDNGFGRIVFFDPIVGRPVKTVVLPEPAKQAAVLPFATKDELFGLSVLTQSNKVYVFPATLRDRLADSLKSKPFYLFTINTTTGSAEGLRLNKQISADTERSASVWSTETAWKLSFPVEKNGRIVDVKMKRQYEHVHSQGRVLGDRSVLYKYSNPNLVAVSVQNFEDNGKGGTLTIYLFDAVTGAVLFSVIHRRVVPPFHLVHCENWLVYTYWNEKARRTEFSVLEMYEGASQTDPDKFSSFDLRPQPLVMRQSYIFPHGVNALAVTDTEKGITSRHLLVALPFGGILELHKAFLDPRRVLMPSMEEREEGLIPYVPDLPIATEHLINYNQSVFHIRAIHAAPAGLESMSLILAYGLDIFYTRVNPSATFDILKDDFDHWFISLMLMGLFLASVLTKRLAKIRDLKLAWK